MTALPLKKEPVAEAGKTAEEALPAKKSLLLRATHWLTNFVGIGWVVNAVVSVKAYQLLEKAKPDILQSMTESVDKLVKPLAGLLRLKSAGQPVQTQGFSKDLTMISLMGIGGFLVMPLQQLYKKNEPRIEKFVSKLANKISGKEIPVEDAKPQEQEESWAHWAGARILAFSAGALAYMTAKYIFPRQYEKASEVIISTVEKLLPQKWIPQGESARYYMAEQLATVSAVLTLWASKTGLDKLFPPKPVDIISKQEQEAVKANAFSHAPKMEETAAPDDKRPDTRHRAHITPRTAQGYVNMTPAVSSAGVRL